jgi:hypothetical protein
MLAINRKFLKIQFKFYVLIRLFNILKWPNDINVARLLIMIYIITSAKIAKEIGKCNTLKYQI